MKINEILEKLEKGINKLITMEIDILKRCLNERNLTI